MQLPDPIAAYFTADRQDPETLARCFTDEAVVKDERRTYRGVAAIEAWKRDSSTRYTYVTEPFALEEGAGDFVVTSRVTGNFPGSPVDLRYRFRLDGGRIAFLEIAP